jgi:hypothetical protein
VDYTSAAFEALPSSVQKCLRFIDRTIGAGPSAVASQMNLPVGGGTAGFVIKVLVGCEFFTTAPGRARVTTWFRADGWRTLDAEEAKLRIKQARLPALPRNSKPAARPVPKPVGLDSEAGSEPTPRRQPSLPQLKCLQQPPLG